MGKTEELRAESVNVIIEKRCRESTSAKYSFFYEQWPYWNLTRLFQVGFSFASTDGSFSNTKRIVIDRIIYIDVVFLQQNILLTFISYQLMKKKLFTTLLKPLLLYKSEVLGAYDKLNVSYHHNNFHQCSSFLFGYYRWRLLSVKYLVLVYSVVTVLLIPVLSVWPALCFV